MASYSEYPVPKEHYLHLPTDESCYEYLHMCYDRISKDIGDYAAFLTPIADQISETSMTKLFDDIEKLSAYFAHCGLKKGDVVAIFLPTCGHALTIFYALNKLGVIANFIHPLLPPDALLKNLEHTKSKMLVVLDVMCAPFAQVMAKYPTVVCSLSDYCDGVALQYALYNEKQNAHVPELETVIRFKDAINNDYPIPETDKRPARDAAAYMHGGGTTGKSKTIILSSPAFNHVAYKYYLLDEEHDYKTVHSLCTLPCFHAYGFAGAMHYAVCNAYKPILVTKFDPVQVNEIIRKNVVTEILSVPRMFQGLVMAPNFENEGLKNIMMTFAGGDLVSIEFVEKFNAIMARNGSKAKLGRGYGLTELCAAVTSNSSYGERTDKRAYKKETAGYPLAGVDLEIWDDDCNKLPQGTVGEIVVSGENIMNGYLPDEDITETGIYTDANGKNWIRTGDMGYLDEDGHMIFSGRKKRIIIIAGYNIYPATIEELVSRLDYVREACAVQGYDDETGKPLVKLCVSLTNPDADKQAVIENLKKFCKENIEGYACPRKFVILDLLPRTKMEKIDFLKLSDKVPQ